jgi:succinyl-CoA synthetase beta subunit
MEALARAIIALCKLATESTVTVVDAEINPLIIHRISEGVVAADALVGLA